MFPLEEMERMEINTMNTDVTVRMEKILLYTGAPGILPFKMEGEK